MAKQVLICCTVLVLAACAWQYLLYAELRADLVQDRQGAFYWDAFHVVFFLGEAAEGDLLVALRQLRDASKAHGRWVYAGKAVVTPRYSSQLGEAQMDAVVTMQFTDRAAYETLREDAAFADALSRFQWTYAQGMKRNALLNVGLHQYFLLVKLWKLFTFQTMDYPFTAAPSPRPMTDVLCDALLGEELATDAIMVWNLLLHGTAEQQAANAAYGGAMLSLMAQRNYGPMHIGTAVSLEEDGPVFDQVAGVYYPGGRYFCELVKSEFFDAIIDNKQVADTQAVITAPLLALL